MVGRTVDERDGPSSRSATGNGAHGEAPFQRTSSGHARTRAWRFTRRNLLDAPRVRYACPAPPTMKAPPQPTHPPPPPPPPPPAPSWPRIAPCWGAPAGRRARGDPCEAAAHPHGCPTSRAGTRVTRHGLETNKPLLDQTDQRHTAVTPAAQPHFLGSWSDRQAPFSCPPPPPPTRNPNHRPRLAGQASNPCKTHGQDTLRSVQVAAEDEPVAAFHRLPACTCRETMPIRDDPHPPPQPTPLVRRQRVPTAEHRPEAAVSYAYPEGESLARVSRAQRPDRVAQVVQWPAHNGKIRAPC